MPDRITKDLARGVVSYAVLEQVGDFPDYPAEKRTAYQQLIATVRTKQTTANDTEVAKSRKHAENKKLYRELWVKLINWYAVAAALGPDSVKQMLHNIEVGDRFSHDACLKRADQTLAVLKQCPEAYVAGGLTIEALTADILEAQAAEAEEQSLILIDEAADQALKDADKTLHQENSVVLTVLQANFPVGSPERALVDRIPTQSAAAAAATTDVPSVPGGTTSTGAPHLPTDLPGGTGG